MRLTASPPPSSAYVNRLRDSSSVCVWISVQNGSPPSLWHGSLVQCDQWWSTCAVVWLKPFYWPWIWYLWFFQTHFDVHLGMYQTSVQFPLCMTYHSLWVCHIQNRWCLWYSFCPWGGQRCFSRCLWDAWRWTHYVSWRLSLCMSFFAQAWWSSFRRQ